MTPADLTAIAVRIEAEAKRKRGAALGSLLRQLTEAAIEAGDCWARERAEREARK